MFYGVTRKVVKPGNGGVGGGSRRQWAADRALRPAMRSPGRPEPSRAVERAFWRLVAGGASSEDAAVGVGVSAPVGSRWFRHAAGCPRSAWPTPRAATCHSPSGRTSRCSTCSASGCVRSRGPSAGPLDDLARAAPQRSHPALAAGLPGWGCPVEGAAGGQASKSAKLATNPQLRAYVEQRLSGAVRDAQGRPIPGPNVPWAGRRHGRRMDRRWGSAWSPEQISHRLKLDFPDDESMRVSHETIYQSLYVQGRGALTRELSACLRTGGRCGFRGPARRVEVRNS